MNTLLLTVAALLAPAELPSAEALLARSIAYHDPQGAWSSGPIEIVSEVTLTERLARERGYAARTDTVVVDLAGGRFEYRSDKAGDRIEMIEQGGNWTVTLNGSHEISAEAMQRHGLAPDRLPRWRDYHTYMYGLPMKLRDPGTRLDPTVRPIEFAGRQLLSLRVTYAAGVGEDLWYFYFDPHSHALVGCRFFHDEAANDGEYLIFEGEIEGPHGLRLPQVRRWYMNRDGEHIATDTIVALRARVDLTAWAAEARAAADAPGLGLVVMRAGEPPRVAVDGLRVAGTDDRLAAGDRWRWGSLTKSMTATLVARLVEQKKISWEDTVERHLGERVPEMRDSYREATFRHLLAHRAGLHQMIPGLLLPHFVSDPEDPVADRLRWAGFALKQESLGALGERYSYSNNGYVVAAAMLEAATGDSWESLIERELFEPLGLESAGIGAATGDQPRGHSPSDAPLLPDAEGPYAPAPAGLVHMSLADMGRYLRAHASRDEALLTQASWELLHTPPFGGDYALGWSVPTPSVRWHSGLDAMFYSEAAFNLDRGTVAAVVVNDGEMAAVQPAVRELLDRALSR